MPRKITASYTSKREVGLGNGVLCHPATREDEKLLAFEGERGGSAGRSPEEKTSPIPNGRGTAWKAQFPKTAQRRGAKKSAKAERNVTRKIGGQKL